MLSEGQIITLNMKVNNSGTILYGHPYLILTVSEEANYIEIAQVDSLKGKEFKAARRTNKIIYADNPHETVIDKDSYIQMDNSLRIEYFDELARLRRQEDRLSDQKLRDVLNAYKTYQENNQIDENKEVYLSRQTETLSKSVAN